MVRRYHRTAARVEADRPLRVRYEPREEIDVAKVGEVLIRIALRTAGDQPVGQSGAHLRRLLAAER
ncbi:hypothetical protein [Helcobacillus massiliensis]|uniref:Uncharacterized protein n=1 Tax=Helcobacillus massiliensis TaxID=521392 RepID=A0A839R384_9MICO|nr:hypothetical protein [Helcobacillus massiliensis]MBB3023916.1 hypothetical protein [Helcobacillus massiliensis]